MPAARIDLPVTRGEDFTVNITRRRRSTGAVIDLSAWSSPVATVKTSWDATSSLFTFSTTGTTLASGLIVLSLTYSQTAQLTGSEVRDLRLTNPATKRKFLYRGRLLIDKDIS